MNQLEINSSNIYLQDCLIEIEKKLDWGESSEWSSYDFEKLSDSIYQATSKKLSANTLKRVWGRLNYESDPSTTTLNILSQYLGYEDWRNFITRNEKRNKSSNSISFKKYFWVTIPIIILGSLLYILLSKGSFLEKEMNPMDFSFNSKKISDGIPNSVVFEYDTPPNIKGISKLEIQQSWDDSKRHTISNLDSIATSIYYSPGYFIAKLVVNDVVIKEHGLLIPSNGWLGILEGQESPIYLSGDELTFKKGIAISDSILNEKLLKPVNGIQSSKLYYIKEFEDLNLDDFNLDMVVENKKNDQQNACPTSNITVYCDGQVIIIPLASKGCVSEINLRVLDVLVSGKTNDLSKFGVDMNTDTSVKLSSSDGELSIFINDILAYSVKLKEEKSPSISGIRYQFKGAGSINEIIIRNKERTFLFSPSL
jgi:hypothetical protein